MRKILFCGLQYEYGKPDAGLSFEYQNFFNVLERMPGVSVSFFGTDAARDLRERESVNAALMQKVEAEQPDLLFCFLFTEEIKKETIRHITTQTKTKTFNWFADDHWRFHIYSKFWAPLFTAVATTDSQALPKYAAAGIHNVLHTQWGANTSLFYPKPLVGENPYHITFVGQNYSVRQQYIDMLMQAGLPVTAYGTGWPHGRIPKEKAGEIWSNSAINLNFTEGNYDSWKVYGRLLAKLALKKEFGRYQLNIHQFHNNLRSLLSTKRTQIKSRNFEIPACGGFLMTGNADNLREYYEPGKEVVIFNNPDDLIEKCRYYMAHPDVRRQIAQAGYDRTLREHTYERRFEAIFSFLGI